MRDLPEIKSIDQEAGLNCENKVCVPRFIQASKWDKHFDWPPPGGLRHIIFHSESNGFAAAIKRVGRTVLIDVPKFWQIVEDSE